MLSAFSTFCFHNNNVFASEAEAENTNDNSNNAAIFLDQKYVTDNSVTVSWNSFPGAETYTIMCNDSVIAENISATQYEITDLQTGSDFFVYINAYDAAGKLLATSDERIFHTNLTVSSNVTLTRDFAVDSLDINEGILNLNGYSVYVDENVNITGSSAKINVDSGKLHINGDLKLQNLTSENSYVGGIEMTNPKGSIYVGGDIEVFSSNLSTLSNGTLELNGNINSNLDKYYNLSNMTSNYKLILSGQNTQTLTLPLNSRLNIVEVKNYSEGGVVFTNRVSINDLRDNGCNVKIVTENEDYVIGWTLNEDEIYSEGLYLAAGTLNLNGHKLTILGDLLQSGGTVFINGGELEVQGDYKLQPFNGINNGILNMTNNTDVVKVNGDFVMQSKQSHDGKLSAGVMEIGGDLIQKNYSKNFYTTENHTILLNGSAKQTVDIYNNSVTNSRITNLKIENTSEDGVEFKNYIYVTGDLHNTKSFISNSANICANATTRFVDNAWDHDITMEGNATFSDIEIGGNLYVKRNALNLGGNICVKKSLYIDKEVNLGGHTLNVGGDVWIGAHLLLNKGSLNIDGDLNVSSVNRSYSNGYLTMRYDEDYIGVKGNTLFYSNSYSNSLTAGTIEIKGDFTQKYNLTESNFYPSGKHQVILSGDNLQKVCFNSSNSRFNILEITNSSEAGVEFLSEIKTVKLITNDCNIHYYDIDRNNRTLVSDEAVDGDLLVESGTLDLNGHTLTISGNLIQTGGTLNINGGTLEVNGDYLINKTDGDIHYSSTGKLLMTNESDIVKVSGNFVMESKISHKDCLTNGILEIGGNLTRLNGKSDNFFTSGNHTVILNGSEPQTVEFYKESSSVITNLKIENSSADGVTFKDAVYVAGTLYNTDSFVNKSENIYAMSETVFENNKWNHSISFSQSRQLPDNLTIVGDIYVLADISLPDNSQYSVSKSNFSRDNLDCYTLSVGGNIYTLNNSLRVNGGSVYINGNLYFGSDVASGLYGGITMDGANDYVLVNGNIYHYSSSNYNYSLVNGILDLKGDFIQSGSFRIYNTISSEFKLILSGNKLQTVKMESEKFSFGTVDVNNHSVDGVFFASLVNIAELRENGCNVKFAYEDSVGWTLSDDEIFDGDLTISRGTLDLNGYKLTVNGSLLQSGGIVFINGGELVVKGDYRIQSKDENEYVNSIGELKMTNESDIVQVSGSFVMQSRHDHTKNLTAGILKIGGDLLVPESGAYNNFYCTKSHTVILDGEKPQRIRIDCTDIYYNNSSYNYNSGYSRINNFKIENTSDDGVDFDGIVYVVGMLYNSTSKICNSRNICAINSTVFENNLWNYDVNFLEHVTLSSPLYINGDVYINSSRFNIYTREAYGKDVLNIEGVNSGDYGFIINGNLYLYSAINLTSPGSVIISGDVITDRSHNGYDEGCIYLSSNGKMFIGGDLKSSSAHSSSFNSGTLEICGDIVFSNENYGFEAQGGHTTIFSGNGLQTVSIAALKSQFDIIEVRNHSDEGVCFDTLISCSEIIDNGCKITFGEDIAVGWTLNEDEIVDGNINLMSGTLDLNGHKLTVNGNLLQPGGTVCINGGELCVKGDYRLQSKMGESYSDSAGVLKMTNELDKVKVEGSFVMQSSCSHKDYLTAGTLEIGGDLLQSGNLNSFHTSGFHTVVLNGNSRQAVKFNMHNVSYSHITNLKIQNTSSQGVEFEAITLVTGKLYDTSSKIVNGKNLHVNETTDLVDNSWSGDIFFEKTPILLPDFYLDGSLYLYSQLILPGNICINGTLYANADINLNGHNFDVENDLWLNSMLYVNNGKLYVGKDLNICDTGFYSGKGYLYMSSDDDYALVNGGMYVYSSKNTYLYKGVLEVKGDFTQKNYNSVTNISSASKVVLSGNGIQTVSIENGNFLFNTLEITKPPEVGYIFNRTPMWRTLEENYIDMEAPSAPFKLRVLNYTSTSIRFKWNASEDNFGECIYDIYRNGRRIASTKDTEYVDRGLVTNAEYSYYVIARDASGNASEQSNTLLALIDPNASVVSPPTNLIYKIKYDGSIYLSWMPPTNFDETVEYSIYRSGVLVGTTKSLAYTDKNTERGYYEYYVEAANGSTSSVSSSVFIDTLPPETPIVSVEEIGDNRAVLNWICSDNVGITRYNLFKNGILYRTLTKNYYIDTAFSLNNENSYYIVAYDASGNASKISNTVSFVSAEDQSSPEVVNLSYDNDKLSDANSIIKVSCKDDTALSELIAEIKPVDSEAWEVVYQRTISKTSDTVEFAVKNFILSSGEYNIRITVKDYAENKSVYEDKFDYVKNELIAPIVTSSLSGHTAYIEWTPSSKTFEVIYCLYRRCDSGDYQCIAKTDELTYTDSALDMRYAYSYYVVAQDAYENKVSSNTVIVKPSNDETKPEILYISCDGQILSDGNNDVNVYCSDNVCLASLKAEIKTVDGDDWINVSSQAITEPALNVKFSLGNSVSKSGEYCMRITVSDIAGNETVSEATFNYAANTMMTPDITTNADGCNVTLNWTAAENNKKIGYSIFRIDALGTEKCIAYIENTNYTDSGLNPLTKYEYYVVAHDENDNTVKSKVDNVTTGKDNIKPIANVSANPIAVVGNAVKFNGSASTDNYEIKSYKWDFGDGTSGVGKNASHIYSDKGSYTVTLTVTDESGNSDVDTTAVEVYGDGYSTAEIMITDSDGNPLPNAFAYCEELAYTDKTTFSSDDNGLISLVAKEGIYDFYFYAGVDYIPQKRDIDLKSVIGGNFKATITLEKADIVTADFNIKELDIAEIQKLGIDVTAPENQFLCKVEMKVDNINTDREEVFEVIVNQNGELINIEANKGFTILKSIDRVETNTTSHGTSTTSTSTSTLHSGVTGHSTSSKKPTPISLKTMVSMSVTEYSWLKDFYEVSITFTNNSDEGFDIMNPQATLVLPRGLSLASTDISNSASRVMNTIEGGTSETVSWIVKGDTKGSYNISVDFKGALSPFGVPIEASFTNNNPIKVIGGDALKLTINASLTEADFTLANISDGDVHNVNVTMDSYGEFKDAKKILLQYPSGLIEKIEWADGSQTEIKSSAYFPMDMNPKADISELKTLKPGESIIGKLWYKQNVNYQSIVQ